MPNSQGSAGHTDSNILMLVGQLLETTKAATEGIKSLSADVRQHSTAIATTMGAITAIERGLSELNRIVRAGEVSSADALVHRIAVNAGQISQITDDIRELTEGHERLWKKLDAYDTKRDRWDGGWTLVKWIGFIFVQFMTLMIAIKAVKSGN